MSTVIRLGRAGVADVLEELDDPPSSASVRTMLRYLEAKGYLRHEQEGRQYVYLPTVQPDVARRSALRELVHTFFGGSGARAIVALLDESDTELSEADVRRLRTMIDRATPKRLR